MHSKVPKLLNSLFAMFKISLLPNHCVKYYDYVKWCSGILRNWCVSLDIALVLASTTIMLVTYIR